MREWVFVFIIVVLTDNEVNSLATMRATLARNLILRFTTVRANGARRFAFTVRYDACHPGTKTFVIFLSVIRAPLARSVSPITFRHLFPIDW